MDAAARRSLVRIRTLCAAHVRSLHHRNLTFDLRASHRRTRTSTASLSTDAGGLKIISIDDVRPGDVVLFSPFPGSATARAQVLLTGAPISHSALAYRDPEYIAEAIHWDSRTSRVMLARAEERFADRTVTIRRPDPPRDAAQLEPVFAAADSYLGEPFSRSNEYLQGLFYLYVRLALYGGGGGGGGGGSAAGPLGERRMSVEAFRRRIARLMEVANGHVFPGRHPMMCAEFVYQCFRDAGPEFRLKIDKPVLGDSSSPPGTVSGDPLDRLMVDIESFVGDPDFMISGRSCEEKVAELIKIFGGDEIKQDAPEVSEMEEELITAICKLVTASSSTGDFGLKCRMHSIDPQIPSPDNCAVNEALFVTPADLYDHCSNLSYVGTIPMSL